jgi:hypothetical protein
VAQVVDAEVGRETCGPLCPLPRCPGALVERVVVGPTGADIRLRVEGLVGLVRDLRGTPAVREVA